MEDVVLPPLTLPAILAWLKTVPARKHFTCIAGTCPVAEYIKAHLPKGYDVSIGGSCGTIKPPEVSWLHATYLDLPKEVKEFIKRWDHSFVDKVRDFHYNLIAGYRTAASAVKVLEDMLGEAA